MGFPGGVSGERLDNSTLQVSNTRMTPMSKKLVIAIGNDMYTRLHRVIGQCRISRFLNDLARTHVMPADLVEGYRAMAANEAREREAAEWIDHLFGDVADEPE